MKNFRTYQLAVKSYQLCTALPLKGDAKVQLLRAARSVALNLAEGRARRTLKDQLRFFNIAYASLKECRAVLDLELFEQQEIHRVLDETAGSLYKLMKNAI